MTTTDTPRRRPTRRGTPICFTIDPDAERLLRAMVPNGRGLGLFLSELIRREAEKRVERPRWHEALAAQVQAGKT